MAVIDARAFALHKAWVSVREDRDPVRARRDFEQPKLQPSSRPDIFTSRSRARNWRRCQIR
ncbi:MAG: hypothetical protein J2P53_12885 [Bradyrhizobiaceae bacterium]|nr:hypothetical protein [Bradyrhizobiaceae bacterium]